MNGVTGKTSELVERWIAAKRNRIRAEEALVKAECELSTAQNELGKWLAPEDAGVGERFNIWYGSGILTAQKSVNEKFDVFWRKEPDQKQRLEQGV